MSKYIYFAALLIAIVVFSYVLNFYYLLGYSISDETGDWAELGDFLGGVLNPLLSFISIALLIKSLTLQNQANVDLKTELRNNERTEKLRSFEILFFNMISSQKDNFEHLKIYLPSHSDDFNDYEVLGVKAVIKIEEEIEKLREELVEDSEIVDFIEAVDKNDQIFGVLRVFYVINPAEI
jgi:hypothetical protein